MSPACWCPTKREFFLPDLFAKCLARPLPKKKRIEVFFLDEATTGSLAHSMRLAAQYTSDPKVALEKLTGGGLLDAAAESWAVYEHDQPFVFAAYWHAESAGGRIHVSAHSWGQDVTRAPAFDFRWEPSAPTASREYRFYLDGLTSLRTRAQRVK